jgi:hypothetical protein
MSDSEGYGILIGMLWFVGLTIAHIVYAFLPLGRGYRNKQIPYELVVKRNKLKGMLTYGYILWPALPILFSSTFWGLGLFLTFIFGGFGTARYLGTIDKKTWDYQEWTRINDPETYQQWARSARAQARRDAAKRTARGAGAFAAGYYAGKNTEL